MKVADLKEIISELPEDTEIILQKDSEGNGYSPLYCWSMGYYIPETTWSGEVYDSTWSAEDCCLEENEWNRIKRTVPLSLIMAPTN